MAGYLKSCNVRGGKIKVTCARCSKTRYVEVLRGTRRKVVRCGCGLSCSYTVNYRSTVRESNSGKAHAILSNAKEALIRMCDTSIGGVGFIIPPEYIHSLYRGQEIRIKYRGSSGAFAQRRLRIRSIVGNRIGAQYS